eukprot:COSAG01_NODE_614_length_14830_cov_87.820572_6_plen_85_part_00
MCATWTEVGSVTSSDATTWRSGVRACSSMAVVGPSVPDGGVALRACPALALLTAAGGGARAACAEQQMRTAPTGHVVENSKRCW